MQGKGCPSGCSRKFHLVCICFLHVLVVRFNSPSFPPAAQSPSTMSSTSGKPRELDQNSSYVDIQPPPELNLPRFFQLVNTDTKAVVVESHRRITGGGSFLKTKTPRHMNLDIADEVVEYTELILLTFLLVWKERVGERAKTVSELRSIPPDLTSILLTNSR